MSSLQDFAKMYYDQTGANTQAPPPMIAEPYMAPPAHNAPVDQMAPNPPASIAEGGIPANIAAVDPTATDTNTIPPAQDANVQAAVGSLYQGPPAQGHGLNQIERKIGTDERNYETNLDAQSRAQKNILSDQARIQTEVAGQKKDVHTAELKENQQYAQDSARQAAVNQAALQVHLNDYQASVDEVGAKLANQPKDIWGATGVNRIAGTIALALGGLSASATGGKNMALEQLERMRDKALAQQKFEYEMLRGKADLKRNQYAMYREKGMDDASAAAAVHQNMLMSQQSQVKLIEDSAAPATAKNNAALIGAQLDQSLMQAKHTTAQAATGQFLQVQQMRDNEQAERDRNDVARMAAAAKLAKLQNDTNPIAADAKAPSADWAKSNRVLAPRLFTTNMQLKLLNEKFEEALKTNDPVEAGILREEMASIAAQIETGIPNPAEPQVIAAAKRFGTGNIFNIQAGRFRPGTEEAKLTGRYIESAFNNHMRSLKSANFQVLPEGDLNQTYMKLVKSNKAHTARIEDEANALLNSGKIKAPATQKTKDGTTIPAYYGNDN